MKNSPYFEVEWKNNCAGNFQFALSGMLQQLIVIAIAHEQPLGPLFIIACRLAFDIRAHMITLGVM